MNGYTEITKLASNRNCLRRIARHDELQFSKDSIVNVMEKFVKTVNVMNDTILVPCRLMDRQVGDSTDIIPAPGKDSTSNQLTHGKRSSTTSKNVNEFLSSSELFNLYNMLNEIKKDLLWTGKDEEAVEEEELMNEAQRSIYNIDLNTSGGSGNDSEATQSSSPGAASNGSSSATAAAASKGGHVRRPSTASVASIVSISNLSDSESEISQENDSGVESEGHKSDNAQSSADSISSSEDVQGQKKKKAANVDRATELAKRCRRHLNGLYNCLEQMTEATNYLTARYQSDIGPV